MVIGLSGPDQIKLVRDRIAAFVSYRVVRLLSEASDCLSWFSTVGAKSL